MKKAEKINIYKVKETISNLRAMIYATMRFENESRELGCNTDWYTEEVDRALDLVEYKWRQLHDELYYAERLSDSVIYAKNILNRELTKSLREICKDPKIYRLYAEGEEEDEEEE